jgi:hypothetical protein
MSGGKGDGRGWRNSLLAQAFSAYLSAFSNVLAQWSALHHWPHKPISSQVSKLPDLSIAKRGGLRGAL